MTEFTFYQCDRRGNVGDLARGNCPARERGMKRKDESDIMYAQAVSPLVNMRNSSEDLRNTWGPMIIMTESDNRVGY